MRDRPYSKERLKHLIHYVIWKAGSRPDFGATKLYKAAWFADARCYVLLGQSITGAPYIRQEHGPIPRDGMTLRTQLENEGVIQQRQLRGRTNAWLFKALEPARIDWFAEAERAHIDYWVKHIAEDHTAASISEESHDYGWEIARMGEKLPFHSVLAAKIREPDQKQMQWARNRAKELGLP